VNPAPNAAAASAMFAQQLQSEIAKNQNPASGSGGPF
jgi:hypothetical protein